MPESASRRSASSVFLSSTKWNCTFCRVVTWPTFPDTRLHSHDGATSAFVPVRGVVTEIRPDDRLRLVPRKFVPGVTGVLDGYDVHELQNEHASVAVSIHAFSPRLRSVTGWERQGDAFVPSASVAVDR